MLRKMIITESQYRMLINESASNIEFDPIQVNDYQFQMIVSINDKQYSPKEINFLVEPHEVGEYTLYQPHLFIDKSLQHQGLGYAIYLAFIHEYGNLYSSHWCRTNSNEIPAIYNKLNNEPDITVTNNGDFFLAVLN